MRWMVTIGALAVGVVLGLTLAALTPGAEAHGGDPDLIHACVNGKGGLRIVGPDDECKQKETPLDWSVQGADGADGADGAQGPPGPVATYFVRNNGVADFDEGGITATPMALCDAGDMLTGGHLNVSPHAEHENFVYQVFPVRGLISSATPSRETACRPS